MSYLSSFVNSQTHLTMKLGVLLVSLSFISACGTDSGAENQLTPNNSGGDVIFGETSYSGPVAEDADVLAFQTELWGSLRQREACSSCHSNDPDDLGNNAAQPPLFARIDDINEAYDAVLPYIDRDTPADSTLVQQVLNGHNCVLTGALANETCAARIEANIVDWIDPAAVGTTEIELRAPTSRTPGTTLSFPADSSAYATHVYPIVTTYCSTCHVEGNQSPFFASSDVDLAYEAAKSKMDLENPNNSRLVARLLEQHNCWDDCSSNAASMESAIAQVALAGDITEIDPALVVSQSLLLTDGIAANTGGRYEDNTIALYEFKAGDGFTAFDTSGEDPPMDLTLSGDYSWVGGWGVQFNGGKGQASTTDSQKLIQRIVSNSDASGAYSIEAWVVPGNVVQEEAHIIGYSGGAATRNFTLGQTLYNYDYFHRSSTTDANGEAALSTDDDAELLQATLQHVVATYSPLEGRRLYINGVYTGDNDPADVGNLNEWNSSFAFVIGNETSSDRDWQGTLRMVAIHDAALTPEQITQNYSVGVGQKFFLLFGVEHLIDVPQSYFVFEVSQFDSYSYLFNAPFFISLDESAAPSNIDVEGLRLGINGKEASIGQAYKNLDIELTESLYTAGSGQVVSDRGTIIALESGPDADEFFITFERLGIHENVVVEAGDFTPPTPADLAPSSDIGIRTFDEINASMSVLTGVSTQQTGVKATYETVRQQLPTLPQMDGFLSAHQMAVTQMAIQYCDALIEDTSLRSAMFPSFDFSESYATAFDADGKTTLLDVMLDQFVGENLDTQPTVASLEEVLWDGYDYDIDTRIDGLAQQLTQCPSGCSADRTETVAKSLCAAILGSATMLIQ